MIGELSVWIIVSAIFYWIGFWLKAIWDAIDEMERLDPLR